MRKHGPPVYDCFSGRWAGEWPNPGDPLTDVNVATLYDIYLRVKEIEDGQISATWAYAPIGNPERSEQRHKFMAYLWAVLDTPTRLKAAA